MIPQCYNAIMVSDGVMTTSISTTRKRHRLGRALAAKLEKRDFSELVNYLLQREIDRYLSPQTQQDLLASDDHNPEREAKHAGGVKSKARPHVRHMGGDPDARSSPREPTSTTATDDEEARTA